MYKKLEQCYVHESRTAFKKRGFALYIDIRVLVNTTIKSRSVSLLYNKTSQECTLLKLVSHLIDFML